MSRQRIMGPGLAFQDALIAIKANNSHDVEIKNFGCSNMYIHSSLSDIALAQTPLPVTMLTRKALMCRFTTAHSMIIRMAF